MSDYMNDPYVKELINTLSHAEFVVEKPCNNYTHGIRALCDMFIEIRERKHKVFFIGNGGSAAIATHMTADFLKNGKLRTVSMYDNSMITCLGNDYAYEYIFSKQIEYIGEEGDLLVPISSSGNSLNIVESIIVARHKGMNVVSFTGFSPDNKVKGNSDCTVYVPSKRYGIVESCHNIILQQIVDIIMNE